MKKTITTIALALVLGNLNAQTISTIAGTGTAGYTGDGASATLATFSNPVALVFDTAGNLYVSDNANNVIRKISKLGIISTVAGNGTSGYSGDGGPATSAELKSPAGVAVDKAGNLYIADASNNRIRKVTISSGNISTICGNGVSGYNGDGGAASAAQISNPNDLAFDTLGNLYVADEGNNVIRMITPGGIISTVAGNNTPGFGGDGGAATSAKLFLPSAVAISKTQNLAISDMQNYRIRTVTSGTITTKAGIGFTGCAGDGGNATSAYLKIPVGIAYDLGNQLFISDMSCYTVRMVNNNGTMIRVAGNGTAGYTGDGGPSTLATLKNPHGITFDKNGNLFIADAGNNVIRKVDYSMNVQAKNNTLEAAVWPNPATESVNVSLTGQDQNAEISLVDLLGKTVLTEKLANQLQTVRFSVSSLTAGIYFVQVKSEGKIFTQKITVQH
jgi:sugar lactone lactonase YvrE